MLQAPYKVLAVTICLVSKQLQTINCYMLMQLPAMGGKQINAAW